MLIELIIRIFISIVNQFTKNDLNAFIEKFPKEIGEKIGLAIKGNLKPLKDWLIESPTNVKEFYKNLIQEKRTQLSVEVDTKLLQIEELVNVILTSIEEFKSPLLIREFYGNVDYFSLWEVRGYSNLAYTTKTDSLKPNFNFKIYLFPSDSALFSKLFSKIKKGIQLEKKDYKKGLEVLSISKDFVYVSNNNFVKKWFIKRKRIPLNVNEDSLINCIADIEEFHESINYSPNFLEKVEKCVLVVEPIFSFSFLD